MVEKLFLRAGHVPSGKPTILSKRLAGISIGPRQASPSPPKHCALNRDDGARPFAAYHTASSSSGLMVYAQDATVDTFQANCSAGSPGLPAPSRRRR